MNNHKATSEENIPERVKFRWSHRFTIVLLLNSAYIVLFYLLMKSYA